ncbi:endonuclease/exonuclease/phosphatase family protein [bacterium]|nr:endonuclease/exonuclease/phosphatase family protein [bacterium]MBU1883653.1 endonuclease/exonuclease/phosphatase family protein [bacterium]
MRFLVLLLLSISILYGDKVVKIATYNVENLFDLKKSGYEYKEYIPNSVSQWNKKAYDAKIKNIAKVIKKINADIIAVQEIESGEAFIDLKNQVKRDGLYYQYSALADAKDTTVKVGIFSRYKILYKKEIPINATFRYRNILEVKIDVDGNSVYLFNNHWKSKAGKESERVQSAKKLYSRIQEIGFEKNIIIVGDFNSDYEENKKIDKKHNDTNGITGINSILHTDKLTCKAKEVSTCKDCLYNLWYDTDIDKRYTYIFKKKKEALDNIIVTPYTLHNKNFHYINGSLRSFKTDYLVINGKINRWQMSKRKPKKHLGKGYSDHLPLTAEFLVR